MSYNEYVPFCRKVSVRGRVYMSVTLNGYIWLLGGAILDVIRNAI